MKYSKEATQEFARLINKEDCLEPIYQLIVNEGCIDQDLNFNNDEVVMNMDRVETKVALEQLRPLRKSMDSAFIIEDTQSAHQEIVFAVYRFNYQGFRNLKRQDLLDKVDGSKAALNRPPNIHDMYYFVFNSNLKQQARRRFNLMNPKVPQHYIATDIRDIKSLFFD